MQYKIEQSFFFYVLKQLKLNKRDYDDETRVKVKEKNKI